MLGPGLNMIKIITILVCLDNYLFPQTLKTVDTKVPQSVNTVKYIIFSYQAPQPGCQGQFKQYGVKFPSTTQKTQGGGGLCFNRQSPTVVLFLPSAQNPSSSVITAVGLVAAEQGLSHPV